MSWAIKEMETLNLSDQRLNKRFIKLLEVLGNKPRESIPVACNHWQEIKAAYRFFDNPRVKAEKLLQPHLNSTLSRIKRYPVVLLLQDTTTLNFTGQKQRSDIGPINHDKHRGLLLHPTLAVTPTRLCLGVVDTCHWARERLRHKTRQQKGRENHKLPLREKESYRWIQGYAKANVIAQQTPETMIVSVADREADIYDIYHEAHLNKREPAAYWLVRASVDRRLVDKHNKVCAEKLKSTVKNTAPVCQIDFELPARNGQPARAVKQRVYAARLRLSPPDRKRKTHHYQNVVVNVVIATEIAVPNNEKPVEWVLLTNVPITDVQRVQDILQWYLCRWQIEGYFRILKSGCRIEKLPLATAERFDACFTLYMIVAWRILYLTQLAREQPQDSHSKLSK